MKLKAKYKKNRDENLIPLRRNALAGAVIIETEDPSYEWEAKIQGTFGENERSDGAFVLSGPLIDNQLAFRISTEYRDKVKDINFNIPSNETLAEDEYRNIRGKLLIEPDAISNLTILLTASHTFDKPGVAVDNTPDNFFDRKFVTGPTTAVEEREAYNTNYVADVTYKINDKLTFRSITSKIDSELEIFTPAGFSFERDETREGDDFTQDVRLQIGETKDTFSGVIGAFYGDFTLPRRSLVTIPGGSFGPVQDLKSDSQTENYSVYADLRFRFLPKWSLLAGGRYTDETIRNKLVDVGFLSPTDVDVSTDYQVFLPKLGLAYDITDNQTLAFVAERGYRSGFAQQILGEDDINIVDPKYLWSYSLSYRAQSPDKKWRFGTTVFYYDYTDQQVDDIRQVEIGTDVDGNPITAPVRVTLNSGESHSYGAEIEGRYAFDNGLTIFGAVGLLKTEFDELTIQGVDFSGNEFPEAPKVTASLGGIYKHYTGFFVSADMNYSGDFFSTGSVENGAQLKLDDYIVVNARAGYQNDHLKLMFFVDNLFGEEYLTSLSNNNVLGAPPQEATIGDGRTV